LPRDSSNRSHDAKMHILSLRAAERRGNLTFFNSPDMNSSRQVAIPEKPG